MTVHDLIGTYKTLGSIEERRLRPPLDDLTSSELAVLRWLLWRLQDDGCHPSDADIAVGTGLSSRSIRRARIGLRDHGLISWDERRASGKRSSNAYDLTAILSACASGLPDKSAELTAKSAPTNGQIGSELPDKMAEEKKNREVKEEEEKKEKEKAAAAAAGASSSDDDLDQLVTRIHAMWQTEVFPEKLKQLTPARRQVVVDRLAAYDPDEIEAAIRNREKSDWFSGRKPQDRRQRFDLTDLLASDETLEELRDAQPIQGGGDTQDFIARMKARRVTDPALAKICARPADDFSHYDATTTEVDSAVPPEDSGAAVESPDTPVDDSYGEEVKAAESFPRLSPAQARAERAEAVEALRLCEGMLAKQDTPFRRSAVESAKEEVARLEREHPTVFGEVAA